MTTKCTSDAVPKADVARPGHPSTPIPRNDPSDLETAKLQRPKTTRRRPNPRSHTRPPHFPTCGLLRPAKDVPPYQPTSARCLNRNYAARTQSDQISSPETIFSGSVTQLSASPACQKGYHIPVPPESAKQQCRKRALGKALSQSSPVRDPTRPHPSGTLADDTSNKKKHQVPPGPCIAPQKTHPAHSVRK